MGRKLDLLLGRKFKTSKFKTTINLAISRLSILKKHRHARLNIARSNIVQLLRLNHHEHALLRVEQVIKDQNMLDVYDMIHGHCHLLIQNISLIEQEKYCPDELEEAASNLLYAAPRCGEFPELQEIRAVLTTRFGKEFAYGAIELRNNCGVSQQMIQKLSPKQSKLESRMKMLTEIATENGIVLQLERSSPEITKEKSVAEKKQNQPKIEAKLEGVTAATLEEDLTVLPEEIAAFLSSSESMNGRKKYRDVADAAQAAFESAAYAAAAARAAVELSRSESFDSDGQDSPNSRPRKVLNSESFKSRLHMGDHRSSSPIGYEENHATPKYDSESEYEATKENEGGMSKYDIRAAEFDGTDSDGYSDEKNIRPFDGRQNNPSGKKMVFDESDNETGNKQTGSSSTNYDMGSDVRRGPYRNEFFYSAKDYDISEEHNKNVYSESHKQFPFGRQTNLRAGSGPRNPQSIFGEGLKMEGVQHLNLGNRPTSVRTKRVY